MKYFFICIFFSNGPRAEWYFGPIMLDVFFQDLLARPPYLSVAIDAEGVRNYQLPASDLHDSASVFLPTSQDRSRDPTSLPQPLQRTVLYRL